jgi:carbon monoxide dehydrogenase subunit G
MDNLSNFESRSGILSADAETVFVFVTDIRNFQRFAPNGTINNWTAEKESCSFSVSAIGTVTVRIAGKEKFSKVIYNGDALKKNDFTLIMHISDNPAKLAEVRVVLSADLNPVMKMMVSKPIVQFLEMLIHEMESFREWEKTIE